MKKYNNLENPFSVVKATEFSDEEINEYWIEFNTKDNQSIISLLNPTEYLPKYIIGSKGTGKTHVLKYLSFPVQEIRASGNIKERLKDDQYIGVYCVIDGINSPSFKGKGIDDEAWLRLFEFYFELYLTEKLLDVVNEVCKALNVGEKVDRQIAVQIINLLNVKPQGADEVKSIADVIKIFSRIRKDIDIEKDNAAFTRKINPDKIKIIFSSGALIFGIPKIVTSVIKDLQDVKIIYILDEYEKLSEEQKIFINTLVWEKKPPCTFWVGLRKYGYTTRATKFHENLKPGSEFQPIILDDINRQDLDLYKVFAKNIFISRVKKYYLNKGIDVSENKIQEYFKKKFEEYNDEIIVSQIQKKKLKEYQHISDLKNNLKKVLTKDKEIDQIVANIIADTDNNPLEQKYKVFSFYRQWAKSNTNLLQLSSNVSEEYRKYMQGESNTYTDIKEKFKADLIAQLTHEYNLKNICHSGLDNFIDLSWGNPRNFLMILKYIIDHSTFKGERPLDLDSEIKISLDTQFLGIFQTSVWFYNTLDVTGADGKVIYNAINLLAELFRINRFSNKPSETSLCAFYFTEEELSESAMEYIDKVSLHNVIIEMDQGRKEKNTGRKERLYQLNKIIASKWNLPTSRRGTIALHRELADVIFNPSYQKLDNEEFKLLNSKLNVPFSSKKSNRNKIIGPNLFNEE